mmetsp:Transcript_101967/g.309314  ORF Transcript_101967/g.309314 Transcript_101967/m.309314 type:complete len:235 (+) Transcript_101967:781-1485(+)
MLLPKARVDQEEPPEQLWAVDRSLQADDGPDGVADKDDAGAPDHLLGKVVQLLAPGEHVVDRAQRVRKRHAGAAQPPRVGAQLHLWLSELPAALTADGAGLLAARAGLVAVAAAKEVHRVGPQARLCKGFEVPAPVVCVGEEAVHEQHTGAVVLLAQRLVAHAAAAPLPEAVYRAQRIRSRHGRAVEHAPLAEGQPWRRQDDGGRCEEQGQENGNHAQPALQLPTYGTVRHRMP